MRTSRLLQSLFIIVKTGIWFHALTQRLHLSILPAQTEHRLFAIVGQPVASKFLR
jgi:hypothetical protein